MNAAARGVEDLAAGLAEAKQAAGGAVVTNVRDERVMVRGALTDLNVRPALQHEEAPSAHGATSPWTPNAKPLTAPEKAFWKDAFIACAHSTPPHEDGKPPAPDVASALCADFADAAMAAYRSRIIWRKP
jgi:hypothetical protein